MGRDKNRARRRFLGTISAGLPAALLGLGTGTGLGLGLPDPAPDARKARELGESLEAPAVIVGDDRITCRKHPLDLGACEAVCVVDMNRDGRLDIVSGENWYEQVRPARGRGFRFIKHKFRDIPYSAPYIEDLSDLAIDVNGDGHPDIVTCSHWSKPLTWWENPGSRGGPWREHVMVTEGSPIEFTFLVDLLNTGTPLQLL